MSHNEMPHGWGRGHTMPRRAKQDSEFNPLEKGLHAPDVRELVKANLKGFFLSKQHHTGGEIPVFEMLSDDSIKTVLRTHFDDPTFDFIHDRCLPRVPRPDGYKDSTVPWTVHFLLRLLDDLKGRRIPKEFQPGMIMLYFKFCMGCDIPPPPLI